MVVIVVTIMVAFFSHFFQLATPLLGLTAVLAVTALGVPQSVFSFVNAFLALFVMVAVKRIDSPDTAEQQARRDQCGKYSVLPKSAIQTTPPNRTHAFYSVRCV
jgi:hypothetical protein